MVKQLLLISLYLINSQVIIYHKIQEIYDPTIEDSFIKPVTIDNIPTQLEILDTAGQEEFVTLRHQWIREGLGFILVYSCTSRASFDEIEKFKHDIDMVKECRDTPIILVANKYDKVSDAEVTREEGIALSKKLNCSFIETSAITGYNVEKAVFDLIRRLRKFEEKSGVAPKRKRKKIKCLVL